MAEREVNWSYLAGFFDGEGNVYLRISKRRYKDHYNPFAHPRITFSNTNTNGMQKIREYLKGQGITTSWYSQKKVKGKPLHHLIICAWDSLENFVLNLIPLSILKTEQLHFLKEAIELHKKIKRGETKAFIPEFEKLGYEISKRSGTRSEKKRI